MSTAIAIPSNPTGAWARDIVERTNRLQTANASLRRDFDALEMEKRDLKRAAKEASGRYSATGAVAVVSGGAFAGGIVDELFGSSDDDFVKASDVFAVGLYAVGRYMNSETLQLAATGPIAASAYQYGRKAAKFSSTKAMELWAKGISGS